MDYERIYRDFIADRRRIEPTLTGYTERHHILPRARGGGDDPENLIRLVPGDHFFAHLLLAKVYGGKMWAPVAFMVGGNRRDWAPVRSRRAYDWVMRGMAASRVGEAAYQFDRRVYRLVHRDGREWSGRQSDMPRLGISRPLANMLVKGRVASARGWSMEGTPPRLMSGSSHPAYCPDVHRFLNVDGREFVGTSFDLALRFGLNAKKTANVRSGRQLVHAGWYRDGFPPSGTGRGAKLPGTYTGEAIRLRHRDGREFTGTRRQAVERLGLSSMGTLSMVLSGRRRHTGGWSVASE